MSTSQLDSAGQTATEDQPAHVAIIMDGNGRWAEQRGLPRTEGHRRGVDSIRKVVKAAIELDIRCLTIFSFSSENWSRPVSEITDLMNLIKRFIRRDLADLHKHGVCIRVIGERTNVEPEIITLIEEAEKLTRANDGIRLTVAFNYGSRAEIASAARRLAERVAAGEITPDDVTVDTFAGELHTAGLPELDLLVRTSGELRLSNFLLWQSAYAELVFLDVYWPDFDKTSLEQAITQYRNRDRRFGGLTANPNS
ncbi:MAG: isoprenyl transferase [Hyphomicrobiaceae bacterium]